MMNKLRILPLLLVSILLSLSSCKKDLPTKDLIEKEQFIEILADIHLGEAMRSSRHRIDKKNLRSSEMYESVLRKHGVSKETLEKTIRYYSRHPKVYDEIYQKVLNRLKLDEEELNPEPQSIDVDIDTTTKLKKR